MAGVGKRALLREVNPPLICPLCRGYLIDATTVVECLHSFCRSCILKHLNKVAHCPSCKHALNKAKPNIKADKALQDIVYKLVPGLYHKEMRKRREFYKKHPEHADSATPEQRGEDVSGRLIFAPEDAVSLSLEYLPPGMDPLTILSTTDTDTTHLNSSNVENTNNNTNNNHNNGNNRRYLQCPALVTIAHLKKFLALKYSVDMTRYTIEICHRRAPLPEHWTLMDVAYIYAWKRIAPMRFFYRVAQEEQRLEAPLHQRPSTPGLGACLPPNDAVVNAKDDGNLDISIDRSAIPGSEAKQADDEASTAKEPSKDTNDKASSPVDNKQTAASKETATNGASKPTAITTTTTTTTTATTTSASTLATRDKMTKTMSSSELTMINATTMLTTTASTVTNTTTTMTSTKPTTTTSTKPTTTTTMTMTTAAVALTATTVTTTTMVTTTTTTTTTTCNDTNNKQMKSPIKIMKNPDGKYEVLRSPSTNWNGKEQANVTTALPDVKPASPEFSVVSIGNGQNSNGVKITLKQCSPTSGTNTKKPKVVSNVLLRCGQQLEKDTSSPLISKQLQKDKEPSVSPPGQDNKQQEKQRRKVTFMDRPISEKTSPSSGTTGVPKTALKKPADQQDKKQFLQGFQLTARESVPENVMLKSPVRDNSAASENNSAQKKDNATMKTEVSPKKDSTARGVIDEVKERSSNTENIGSNASNSNISANTLAKRVGEVSPGNNARAHLTRSSDDVGARTSSGSVANNSACANINANTNGGHSATKMDVYSFHPSDSPVLAGAVKRKCPPGVPINDLKRRRHHSQPQSEVSRKLVNFPADVLPVKRTSSSEHMIPTSRTGSGIPDYHNSPSRPVSNMNAKTSTGPTLSSDTRNLLDGCGLNIPSSLSITLTSPKSPGTSLFPETDGNDSRKAAALGKMNPTITLNDRSVDPRVLKALKTGQIKMPAPPKTKLTVTKQTDQASEAHQQQRATPPVKRSRREQESILDLSGGKKTDIHPLRIPQPVTKLKANNKTANSLPDDQGQVVTLMGGHRYYRAPPGSLTPAAHRVNECSPLPTPSRAPVYAPALGDISRTSPNLSSVFPSLQSLYVLSQSQFQMDGRLRLPPSPRSAAESIASAVMGGSGDGGGGGGGGVNSSGLSGLPGKTHLAAQCAPVKPARSSVASLAVPINKQQHSVDKSANISIRNVPSDTSKSAKFQRNNEAPADESCAPPRLTAQTRYSSSAENANKFSSRNNTDQCAKSNDQTSVENAKNSTAEAKNESTDNSRQQHHDTASPRVSSTASPSPPPGNNGGNSRNEGTVVSHGDGNKSSNAEVVSTAASATSSSPPKSNADTTSCKSPASPDSSSVTVESPTSKSCASSTDRSSTTDNRTMTDTTTKSSDSVVNPDDNSSIVADGTTTPADDKSSKVVTNPPVDAKQQLTTEIVQKRLLAVFPSNEWANNPEAAEHLGNFLKSLHATIKSDGHTEESKADKIERKTPVASDAAKLVSDLAVKPRKDVVEQS